MAYQVLHIRSQAYAYGKKASAACCSCDSYDPRLETSSAPTERQEEKNIPATKSQATDVPRDEQAFTLYSVRTGNVIVGAKRYMWSMPHQRWPTCLHRPVHATTLGDSRGSMQWIHVAWNSALQLGGKTAFPSIDCSLGKTAAPPRAVTDWA